MNRFFRYVVTTLIKNLLIVEALTVVMTLFVSSLRDVKYFERYDITLIQFFIHELLYLPSNVTNTMPIVLIISTMITIITLQRNNEIVAYVSLGGKLTHLYAPFIALSLVFASLMYVSENTITPNMRYYMEKYRANVFLKTEYVQKSNIFNVLLIDENGDFSQIEIMDPVQKIFSGITEYKLDQARHVTQMRTIKTASHQEDCTPHGGIENREGAVDDADNCWLFTNVTVTDFTTLPFTVSSVDESLAINSAYSDYIKFPSSNPKLLTSEQLRELIKISERRKQNSAHLKFRYYQKYSTALSGIVLVFLLLPIGISFGREYSIVRVSLLSIAMGGFYWSVLSIFKNFGQSEIVSPFTSNFFPHMLFFIIASALMFHKSRGR